MIFVTILGVMMLDFDCDACQSPARAYLIDVCRPEDHSVGLSMFTVMAGAGGCIGYTLGGIAWADLFKRSRSTSPSVTILNMTTTTNMITKSTALTKQSDWSTITNQTVLSVMEKVMPENSNGGGSLNAVGLGASVSAAGGGDIAYEHKQILFTMVAVIFVICVAISVTSFKEIPLEMLEAARLRQQDGVGGVSGSGSEMRMRVRRGSMKYNRMEESNFDDDYGTSGGGWEHSFGDDIDAISIDRVEFKREKAETGKFDAIKS